MRMCTGFKEFRATCPGLIRPKPTSHQPSYGENRRRWKNSGLIFGVAIIIEVFQVGGGKGLNDC